MTPLYGRLQGGKRLYDSTPAGHWNTTTLISSIRLDGSTSMMVLDGASDGEAFLTYIQKVLIPDLHPGDIVVMDNLATHKVAGVQEALKAADVEVWYLPPYSPDLNPIEKMWSKIKTHLRLVKARTQETLWQAICEARAVVTPSDARGWFQSCGYGDTLC
jgi:transposase